MFEKIFLKGYDAITTLFTEEPLIAFSLLFIILFLIYSFYKLWKGILIAVALFFLIILSVIFALDYKKTHSLEYQLAMQMFDEKCVDTIEIERYMRYENITFVNGRQYRYGEIPLENIVRNYVCHESKTTYSVDFILDVYAKKSSWKDDFSNLMSELRKTL